MKLKTVAIAAGLLLLPASAFAQFAIQYPNGSGSDSDGGWVAGLHTGYNWQRGALVYGVEADINWTDLKSEITKGFNVTLPGGVPLPSARTTSEIDWFGTVRGRLGWTNGPMLFYGTGGLAYGKVSLDSRFDFGQFQSLVVSSHADSTKVGWVAGLGVNYLWNPNTILSLNYQYVDLGKLHIADAATNNGSNISQSATAHAAFHEVTVGVSWLFQPADAT